MLEEAADVVVVVVGVDVIEDNVLTVVVDVCVEEEVDEAAVVLVS